MNKNIKKWGFSDKDVELFKIIQLFAFAAAFLLIALLMRRAYYDFESWDYTAFLSEWFEHIKGMPGLSGFGADISDYTPMYKYIITIMTKLGTDSLTMYKNVSVFFDVVMAVFMGLLIYEITEDKVKGLIAYAITLFMPTVFLNSAVWGQCDSIFTCFAVMSLYFIVKGKGGVGMAFFALSFSFKLQAIFFLPAIVIYCIKGKI
ncbi:MAG: glycosyltransferase family 39 protein, partial [Clostridia bacterium]|nr:glycosyltransferase family 39 protein [Clostridia bacterium]